jgi:hypothetical protein
MQKLTLYLRSFQSKSEPFWKKYCTAWHTLSAIAAIGATDQCRDRRRWKLNKEATCVAIKQSSELAKPDCDESRRILPAVTVHRIQIQVGHRTFRNFEMVIDGFGQLRTAFVPAMESLTRQKSRHF